MSLRAAVLVLFLAVAGLLVSPEALRAETVGVVITHGDSSSEKIHEAFVSYLDANGFRGRIRFLVQRPYPDPIAWSNAARKLIAAEVDVPITYGASATLSALREKSGIPIIYAGVYEPIAASIDPKAAAGVCCKYQVSSLVRYLRDSASMKDLGVIYSSAEEDSSYQLDEVKRLSGRYGFAVTEIDLGRPFDLAATLSEARVDAIFITSSAMANSVFPTVIRAAEGRKIPTASLLLRDDPGATMMLSTSPQTEGEAAAEKLVQFLKGTPLGEIPSSCSNEIELVFDLRSARKMGVRISMDLVTEATRIIY
jgi:putative ABC transport system substrate-binding protein